MLRYILNKKPAYIIADNLFESVDIAGQQDIKELFANASQHILIVQILYRKEDCLPFIDTVITIKNRQLIKQQTRAEFLSEKITVAVFTGTIPASYQKNTIHQTVLVEMKNLSVQFDERPILNNICWQIKQGEFWQLIGPNGSGKSTLLSMITGDSVKGYGQELYLFGRKKGSGETVWEVKQQIGYFSPSLVNEFPRQDSIEHMIIAGFIDSIGLYVQPTGMQITIAQQWLRLLGLFEKRQQPFRLFTLCQQRMILIARAMVKHPPLLILGEPTAGLDDENALLFVALVNKIAAETITAIVYVSHRIETGLLPGDIFELVNSEKGSAGRVQKK